MAARKKSVAARQLSQQGRARAATTSAATSRQAYRRQPVEVSKRRPGLSPPGWTGSLLRHRTPDPVASQIRRGAALPVLHYDPEVEEAIIEVRLTPRASADLLTGWTD